MMHSVSVISHSLSGTACQQIIRHDVRVYGRLSTPNMLFKGQELSLQNVLSLLLFHLCGTFYPQIYDSRLTLLFLNANLKLTCLVLPLLTNFLPFLQRVSIACYAEHCISYDRFCLTV